jgi:hypothetical protein
MGRDGVSADGRREAFSRCATYNVQRMVRRIVLRSFVLAVLLLAVAIQPARAEGFISPFIGFNFGGDSACPAAASCDQRTSNYGVAIGSSNALFGFEEEFAYAKHFFGPDDVQVGSVLTLMSNLLVAPDFGVARPYGLIGLGVIKTHVDLTLDDIATSDISFGWNIGGGLELGGAHVGVRGDVRYVHGFQDVEVPLLPVKALKLDFGRAAAGVVFRF